MAFTTTVGAGGTSLIGTSGVDTTTFAPGTLATAVFIGAQGDNDFITLQTNQANNYTIRGGTGADVINAAGFRNSVVTGDDGDDTITITGTIQSSTVSGLEGVDTIAVNSINGGVVNGNNGNDKLSTTGGSFTNNGKLVGGQGNDTFTLAGGVTLTSGIVNGQDGDDTITITNVAPMASTGATIFGGQGSDTISAAGNVGQVVISGDLGTDNLTGSGFNDTIFGGDGNDRITGSFGADSMIGGSGVDTFIQGDSFSEVSSSAGIIGNVITAQINNPAPIPPTPSTFDVISGFEFGLNGDIISGMGGGAVAPAIITSADAVTAGRVYALSGSYNATTGVFTSVNDNSGQDTILVTANNTGAFNTLALGATNWTVLQSVNVTTITASNFA